MSKPKPSNKACRQIDENLRRVFQEDLDEELPDRFKTLLMQLKESGKSSDGREHR